MTTPSKTAAPEIKPRYRYISGLIERHITNKRTTHAQTSVYVNAYNMNFHSGSSPSGADIDGVEDPGVTSQGPHLTSFVDQLQSTVVPPNPSAHVQAETRAFRRAAMARTSLVNYVFKKENMYDRLNALTARTSVMGHAFIKTTWNGKRRRPAIRVIPSSAVFFDSIADTWDDIRYLCEATVLTRAQFESRIKKPRKKGYYKEELAEHAKFGQYPNYLKHESGAQDPRSLDAAAAAEAARAHFEWVVVYEFYDFEQDRYYHFIDGCKEPLYEGPLPYSVVRNPFAICTFTDNLIDLCGLSDARIIWSALQRLNELDTLEIAHIKAGIPRPYINTALLDNPDAFKTALSEATEPNQAVAFEGRANATITDIISYSTQPSLPVNWGAARDNQDRFIKSALGTPDYARGVTGSVDVATEAQLADEERRDRIRRRQMVIYGVCANVTRAIIGLYAQYMSNNDTIVIFDSDTGEEVELTREALVFPPITSKDQFVGPEVLEGFDYEVSTYNADQDNPMVRLRKLEALLPIIAPALPPEAMKRLIRELLKLLGMPQLGEELVGMMNTAPPAGAPPGLPGGAPAAQPPEVLGTEATDAANLQGGIAQIAGANQVPGAPLPPAQTAGGPLG